jgi:hypothetical protein
MKTPAIHYSQYQSILDARIQLKLILGSVAVRLGTDDAGAPVGAPVMRGLRVSEVSTYVTYTRASVQVLLARLAYYIESTLRKSRLGTLRQS